MNASDSRPAFLAVWDHCYQQDASTFSDEALRQAVRSWLDTLAVSAGGATERCTQAALHACAVGRDDTLSPADVALVLGTASHALDYDDVSMLATCHPSAPPIVALLALLPVLRQQRPDLRWSDVLRAYIVGTETTLRLGQWLGFQHYALGFHATSTLGTVGAAAACAHALRLPLDQAHAALSIAASSACGLRANFGTDVKPLHVGFAAAAAVRAVMLARAGAAASDDVWGDKGFMLAFNGGHASGPLAWRAGEAWAIESPGFEHKRFPSCYMTHRLIAGVTAIRERQPEAVRGQPVTIDIEFPKNGLAPLKYPIPSTGLEGKFSGAYCASAAWIEGSVTLSSFDDSAVQDPTVCAQMARVHLRERTRDGEPLDSAPIRVSITGTGWSDDLQVDWAPGSAADPMTRDQLLGKWRDCARHGAMARDDAPAVRLLDASPQSAADPLLAPLREALLTGIRAVALPGQQKAA
ncbi:MAG TPA: MmgE/PrpD family protein [Burkholderiaceae bacterium]|jgi:2-methylcitrate dehydratase PrpD|nr:MmgE/PrpD family protein [Burkholderiaceae bacterium]